MSALKEWAVTLLFPRRCCLCGAIVAPYEHMCATCYTDAPFILPPVCSLCGRSEDDCACEQKRRSYARCVSPFRYEGVVRKAMGTLKNQGYVSAVDGLAVEMAEVIRREYGGIAFDYVCPVPLHKAKNSERGFNQSALLAEALSRMTGVPYADLLVKLFQTAPQKELSLEGREANLLGAFDVSPSYALSDKTVLLVDDLITTGSTLNECAKMLKIAGTREVYVVTAAAVLLKKRQEDG